MAQRHHMKYLASAAAVGACASLAVCVPGAFATTRDDLTLNYQLATEAYVVALDEQKQNAEDITAVENELQQAEQEMERSRERLGSSAVALYKHERSRTDMLDLLLGSSSITDAIERFENYTRIQGYWSDTLEGMKRNREELGEKKEQLESEKELISEKVARAVSAMGLADAALKDADHSDGARYHQRQGNGSNCGATAFAVGVNILLHANYYTDNVAVWNGPGFNGDSTQNLALKGTDWLLANGLADQISCYSVVGDIHNAAQLQNELEQGKVVVISSGSGSVWQRADGTQAAGLFPSGHWVVFYHYADGVFYANDSSVQAGKGAGCPYTAAQMQQWLDGRTNHFATVLAKKQFGTTQAGELFSDEQLAWPEPQADQALDEPEPQADQAPEQPEQPEQPFDQLPDQLPIITDDGFTSIL